MAGDAWYPLPDATEDLYLDFHKVERVRLADLEAAGRRAAMTHDARLTLIRRDLYYRYRWLVSPDSVLASEKARISNDPAFAGPRPAWAS